MIVDMTPKQFLTIGGAVLVLKDIIQLPFLAAKPTPTPEVAVVEETPTPSPTPEAIDRSKERFEWSSLVPFGGRVFLVSNSKLALYLIKPLVGFPPGASEVRELLLDQGRVILARLVDRDPALGGFRGERELIARRAERIDVL